MQCADSRRRDRAVAEARGGERADRRKAGNVRAVVTHHSRADRDLVPGITADAQIRAIQDIAHMHAGQPSTDRNPRADQVRVRRIDRGKTRQVGDSCRWRLARRR